MRDSRHGPRFYDNLCLSFEISFKFFDEPWIALVQEKDKDAVSLRDILFEQISKTNMNIPVTAGIEKFAAPGEQQGKE